MANIHITFSEACNGLPVEKKCEASETICEAVFRTNLETCNSQCQSFGLDCEDAWNEYSGTCRKKLNYHGCDNKLRMQICRCKLSKSTANYFYCPNILSIIKISKTLIDYD